MPAEKTIIIPTGLQESFQKGREDMVFFAKTFLGVDLHAGQAKFVKNSTEKINILVPANRWGKSLLIAVKHIWHCFYKIGVPLVDEIGTEKWMEYKYETLNIAPHSEMARVVLDLTKQLLTSTLPLGNTTNKCLIGWVVEAITQNPYMTIVFWNGATLYSRTIGDDMGSSVQGQSYYYISYDECCRSRNLEKELLDNILPRVASTNGKVDLISTPDKDSISLRYYFQIYNWGKEGKTGYYSQDGSAVDNPYLPKGYVKEIEDMREGDEGKDQVLYGKFVFSGEALFNIESLNKAVDNSYEYPEKVTPGHLYTMGIDTAASEDFFVITVIDYTNSKKMKLVRFERSQGKSMPLPLHLQKVREIYEHYNQYKRCEIICDKTNEGGAYITQFLEDLNPFGYRFGIKDGLNTKYDMLIALKSALEKEILRIPYEKELLDELWSYRTDDTKLRTDCVMSLGLAVWYATVGRPKKLPPVIDIEYIDW